MDGTARFNEAQQRRILANAEYADKLLADIESIVAGSETGRLFQKHIADLTPQQARLIRSSISLFRRHLGRFLQAAGIDAEGRQHRFGALHSILVTLAFVRIAMQEMAPEHLRGYGGLEPEAELMLRGLANQLESLIATLEAELRHGSGADLEARLRQAPAEGAGALLQRLERILREEELAEFRPALVRLVEKLENPAFELAVFGRVSSGKSSLLNRLLGSDVLPVGVTPVTAVPVRVVHGETPSLTVSFAGGRMEEHDAADLPLFATEELNPANRREVLRLILRMPSPLLRDGLVLVDTPGLGSLATAGAAETLSYLPRCDLGLVLVSAATPLSEEDVATLDLLVRAGAPAMVLLSKADLLGAQDLERAMRYTEAALERELGRRLPVAAVSVAPTHSALLEGWRSRHLEPVLARHRELAQESLLRKATALRESVAAALRSRAEGSGASVPRASLEQAEAVLGKAAARLEAARRQISAAADAVRGQTRVALAMAVAEIVSGGRERSPAGRALRAAAVRVCDEGAAGVRGLLEAVCVELSQAVEEARRLMRPGSGAAGPAMGCEEMRGLPMPQLEMLPGMLPRPAVADVPLAGRWLAKVWLEKRAAGALGRLLEAYSRSLEAWALRQLEQMQGRFDAEAGVFRAEIARLLSAGGAAPERRERLQRWLAELEGTAESPGAALTPSA
ncbi:MAG: dynamin family protein [Bryobacteraceae bacterium]|nr:dynamin family protein [Bryobacteraceae bacterium]